MAEPLIEARGLVVEYPAPGGRVRAVDGVDLVLQPGESLGLVGESGCGKSTLGRALLGLVPASAGEVYWSGRALAKIPRAARRRLRRDLQIVFQDPLASLDPRMTIGASIAEPLEVHAPALGRAEIARRVHALLERVGLDPAHANRYPHEFSGGQCQRVGIARAMVLEPRVVVCDEPVSALDVSVQGQIVNLLADLQRERGTALLFISHNLAVVRRLCPRVLVMYLGRVVEQAPRAALFDAPLHPYTRVLLDAVPAADPRLERTRVRRATGEPGAAAHAAGGCAFRTRCPHALERCARETPALEDAGWQRRVACHRWREGLTAAR